MTASERAAGELVADVDTLAGVIRRYSHLSPQYLAEALVDAGFGRIDAARREALLSAADSLDQQRIDFAEEDEAEGCTSRFCGGWINGVRFTAMHLRNLAHQIGADS